METLYETIYRPPTEHRSALLELSVGCSWGKCIFCRLADGKIPLQIVPVETLKRNLMEMVLLGETPRRMFLTGENALAFRTRYLLDVFGLVRSYLPTIEEFALYGRADDIGGKTGAQLGALKSAGLATVYVGLESGNPAVLKRTGKGVTPDEIARQLQRLDTAGIGYGLSSIIGLGGQEYSEEHVRDTAAFYNSVGPVSIRMMTLTPKEGTPLARMIADGKFRLLAPEAILAEERALIASLNPGQTGYRLVANHVSNEVPIVGNMPQDKERLLAALDAALESPYGAKRKTGHW